MQYTRLLKVNMKGDDVKYVKDKLVSLGYLHASTHNKFGYDTKRAVRKFQEANNLEADGIVGPLTWAALFGTLHGNENAQGTTAAPPVAAIKIPSHIGAEAAEAIGKDLATVSKIRQQVCLEALKWAIDPYNNPQELRAFYIRGGNMYNKDLKPNLMTKSKLDSYFKRTDYEPYYDEGRKEMMRAQSEKYGYDRGGADCSGLVVGVWRVLNIYSTGFDATANSLYKTYCVNVVKPTPGDLAWRSGHIGIYVGGGYIVESIGGAYGVQITKKTDRRAYNFVDKKIHKFSNWSKFGDPKKY